ncbi:MAG: D-alanyl-D-alanine carboxypeptidase [Oscillospiraceae bacterium]|nr:D-alanyl-D-alanine carboxypeptidase [Oscillospiraceae bacterium]
MFKKFTAFFLIFFSIFIPNYDSVFAQYAVTNEYDYNFTDPKALETNASIKSSNKLSVSAQSAILMDASNKVVIFKKNENQEKPIASTTKIMTALLTVEEVQKNNRIIKITDKMVPVEGSSMYLKEGDELPLLSLAKGMLTVSGNDAAQSAAIAISGSIPKFAKLMNKKAKEIGMKNTHFVTPSGLDDTDEEGDHHSTAYDMALLGIHAINNKSFLEICSKKICEVPFTVPDIVKKMPNSNRLLRDYKDCFGIKTGFTKIAGRCLVSGAERNGVKLVAVTLNDKNDWNDHKKMLNYGFDKIESINLEKIKPFKVAVVGSETKEITVLQNDLPSVNLEKGKSDLVVHEIELDNFLYAPIKKFQVVGKIKYKLAGEVILCQELFAENEAKLIESGFLGKYFGWIFNR